MNIKRLPAVLLCAFTFVITLAACDTGSPAPTSRNFPTPTTSQSGNSTTATAGTVGTVGTVGTGGIQSPAPTQRAPTSTVAVGAGGATTPVMTPNSTTSTSTSSTPEQPIAPEQNPVGDIPDTQAFVKYTSAAGAYELDTPEGWARTENGAEVSFVDKLDGVKVMVIDAPAPPTVKSVQSNFIEVAHEQSARAVQVDRVEEVQLPSGKGVLVEYTSNSEPNPVTGKQVRLENNAYLIYKVDSAGPGKLATVTLWAPVGADNVDQWQRMSQSFRWR